MAYAGTPTGLAQQAGASRPWKTVLAAIAVLAIGLALVIAVMFINSRAVAPTTGRTDAQIEAQRDATLLSAAATSNAIEKAAAAKARAMSGVPGVVNTTSTAVEKAAAARARAMSGVPAGGTRLDATSVDRKYQEIQSRGAHGPLR